MTIAEFWNNQKFSYLTTYSFNRAPNLAVLHRVIDITIKELGQSVSLANFLQQFKLKRQLAALEQQAQMGIHQKRLITKQGVIDSTADRIALIKSDSLEAKQLGTIARALPSETDYAAGCIPVYRDALAFYNEQGQLLRVLNICFECLYMEASDGVMVKADPPTYEALREVLSQLGHPIESVEN
ncbi:hypothetical protein [Hymenobacter bucti]|uniref:Uncharacterized protein n=1 Tax=Hymenobacter bucti TaxID=1844114 RepID=A0ABW4QRA1_9BACT